MYIQVWLAVIKDEISQMNIKSRLVFKYHELEESITQTWQADYDRLNHGKSIGASFTEGFTQLLSVPVEK
jgi:hypothetical protein